MAKKMQSDERPIEKVTTVSDIGISPTVIDKQIKASKPDPYSQRAPGVKVRPALRTAGTHDNMSMSFQRGGLRNWRPE